MEIDIKCLECGKATRKFELGKMFYLPQNASDTLVVKNSIICPKCKKDISGERCIVKANELLMRLVTANICISVGDLPPHLEGAFSIRKKDYDLVKGICKSRLKLV